MEKIKISVNELTEQELEGIYGKRKYDVGKCFKNGEHYYIQRENDVLHVFKNCINNLNVGYLHSYKYDYNEKIKEVSLKKFNTEIKKAIYTLEIEKYWKIK